MKRLIIGLFIGMLGGATVGFGGGIFIYPFWFLNDIASESLSSDVERTELAAGMFIQANPSDPVHKGSGTVTIYEEPNNRTVVFLDDDFEVGPGPAFHVYLVDHPDVRARKDFLESHRVDLGNLRAFRGSQVYPVGPDVELSQYKSVVVWCEEFGVLISPASLSPIQSVGETSEKLSQIF